ncbi:M14 family metallopeptidase [Pseudomonas sp. PDM19]|uniref:M14 family metallopeptidase n=1 Tax=Pseudomonas sp. PDM19 TaxID=2769272 RepID=UPI001785F8DD|nr:M14 family metallopeptidase [Pseudomonas sp. PDM19]MBD9631590.1 M14 family metallopeptidase [Pseudomonas sp. PDM19]
MNASSYFSQSYAQARSRFLDACAAAGLLVESHVHPLTGRDGETLAVDVAREGPLDAKRLLIISSGCHGVEGFCGSGVQSALLADPAWREHARRNDCAVLYLHAANPYGFSWWRRWTQENVDLNRNFRDFTQAAPQNPGYAQLDPVLAPRRWPSPLGRLRLLGYALRHGRWELQKAISSGQASHPDGLFFSGSQPTWSNRTVREVLRQHGRQCREMAWIDVHTGLGPSGYGEYIYSGDPRPEALVRARAWWGDEVRSTEEGNSVSVKLSGKLVHAAFEECPQALLISMSLEFGTVPGPQVLEALRADQWLHRTPDAPAAKVRRIKQQLRDAFYIDTDQWKSAVLRRARDTAWRAVEGLRSEIPAELRSHPAGGNASAQ